MDSLNFGFSYDNQNNTCENCPLWNLGSQVEILLRILEKIDEFHNLNFSLLAACDILKIFI
jgi:hypothetical protein